MDIGLNSESFSKIKYNHENPAKDKQLIRLFSTPNEVVTKGAKDDDILYIDFHTPSLTKEQVLRYIIYTADKESPFVKQLPNPVERKKAVLEYIECKTTKAKFYPEDVQDIIKNKNPIIARMIVLYLRSQGNRNYFAYYMAEQGYYNIMEQISQPADGTKEGRDLVAMMKSSEDYETTLDRLAKRVTFNDASLAEHIGTLEVDIKKSQKLWLFVEDFVKDK